MINLQLCKERWLPKIGLSAPVLIARRATLRRLLARLLLDSYGVKRRTKLSDSFAFAFTLSHWLIGGSGEARQITSGRHA